MRTQSVKGRTFITALRQCWTFPSTVVKTTSGYMGFSISIGRMPLLMSSFDNVDPLFVVVITPDFYLHHVEVADEVPASCSL